MTLDEAIKVEETIVKDNERYVNLTRSNYAMPGTDKRKKEEKRVGECEEVIEEHRQLAEWLKELKEFKVLFVKANRDVGNVHLDNRAIFEKFFWEVWKILDVKGLEEVNADDKGESVSDDIENN